ncbi:DUF764 family protein [Borrelia miyamotoi]|uniref:DUF764 family protein n=1 Tax=Borrelia miyamotoi TaxID=47466 RepID=UPI000A00A2A1|nr:DUF764 family protein [Borrelia miyamotoi]QTL83999.1 DUF764 family protein [Borrelia miyamotoi]QTL84031.1 DUF764 family protein [Borrelia miyamotoi]QTL84258.1 DUF764 family protein [Borrelia miyamotoi]WAZ85634.1 DUF764 family protein [Borrelia miyamotoi]WAZ85671.1 DUF764 family protein [Borrelia miyamotoi]
MILDIYNIQKYIITILKNFKEFVTQFDIQVINTYNHPYMSKLTVDNENVLVIKFDNVEGLFNHNMRTGAFYDNVNEMTYALYTVFHLFYTKQTSKKCIYKSTRVILTI